jgi:RHS repeat-associated protein
VTDTYTYDAFGVLLASTGATPNVYLYTGEQLDPNVGFYYLRARYYDAAIGRFITIDPRQGNIFEPVSLHRYLYGGANPVNNRDPSGLDCGSPTEIVLAGHGTLYHDDLTVVPEGSTITFYAPHLFSISDRLGRAIETGDATDTGFLEIYYSGDSVPDYTLSPPSGLNITNDPRVQTVNKRTDLSDLLKPNTNYYWAACRQSLTRNQNVSSVTRRVTSLRGMSVRGFWDIGGFQAYHP